ncbi:MAG TPA: DUF1501 domain-containing protein [Gemmataceae bacterium]|nr:DUF1501 domain-containing protein [Gemmataceae bacterium]
MSPATGAVVLRFFADHRSSGGVLTRREWLRIGGLAGLGLLTGPGAAAAARPFPGFGKAKSVLVVFTSGGQSQIDTWDPKPDAPEEIRGAFRPIAASVPGLQICEHLPRVARLAHLYAVVRSVCHDDLDHGTACYLALTGRFHSLKSANPPPRPDDYPTYGAVVRRLRPAGPLPYAAVHVNGPILAPLLPAPGQFAGQLGASFEPLLLGDVTTGDAGIAGLDPTPDLPPMRLDERKSLLEALEDQDRRPAPAGAAMKTLYGEAYRLLSAPGFRRAFRLDQEPEAVRDAYGRHRSGQACLLGRRLVEAGVPYVAVLWNHCIRGQDRAPDDDDAYGWDTHNDIFASLKDRLLPRFDRSFAALLTDLQERGLLDTTLVVCMGEFGRAPRVAREKNFVGDAPGRKHWAAVYSIVMAGAGVTGGGVFGASDRIGGYPAVNPVGPWDVAATLFAALGVDPAAAVADPAGRTFPVSIGEPIGRLWTG